MILYHMLYVLFDSDRDSVSQTVVCVPLAVCKLLVVVLRSTSPDLFRARFCFCFPFQTLSLHSLILDAKALKIRKVTAFTCLGSDEACGLLILSSSWSSLLAVVLLSVSSPVIPNLGIRTQSCGPQSFTVGSQRF